ncbi:MAG: PDZ domain-containing protein [Nautiliaceae bacterium]
MKNFKLFIIAFLSSYLLWSIALLFLPRYPLIYTQNQKPISQIKISLTKIFLNSQASIIPKKSYTLKNITLKGVYISDKEKFIIISSNKKTYFINLNETFRGYKLIKITPTTAYFKKGDTIYKVSFKKIKLPPTTPLHKIPKTTIKAYEKNFAKIWQDIGIIKTKDGYKITFIKRGSIFDKIGLKRGDILLSINNIPLNSDANAWKAYNTLKNQHHLTLKIKRNSQIKVIEYEIY